MHREGRPFKSYTSTTCAQVKLQRVVWEDLVPHFGGVFDGLAFIPGMPPSAVSANLAKQLLARLGMGAGDRTGNPRLLAAFRPRLAPRSPVIDPGQCTARFAPIFSLVDRFQSQFVTIVVPFRRQRGGLETWDMGIHRQGIVDSPVGGA